MGRGTCGCIATGTLAIRLLGVGVSGLGREMLQPSAALCEHVEVFELPTASHWVQHEEPEAVIGRIIELAERGVRC
jgi:pimeloyl-ACP methyl ester carboxylesterase